MEYLEIAKIGLLGLLLITFGIDTFSKNDTDYKYWTVIMLFNIAFILSWL